MKGVRYIDGSHALGPILGSHGLIQLDEHKLLDKSVTGFSWPVCLFSLACHCDSISEMASGTAQL